MVTDVRKWLIVKFIISIVMKINAIKLFFGFSVFLAFFPLAVMSQTRSAAEPNSISKEFNLTLQHATIVVSDFAVSKKFYVEILGLEDLNADWLPENQMFLSLGNNLELHVGEVKGVEIRPSDFNHFAISTNDLNGYLKHLESHGVVYSSLGGERKKYVHKRTDGVRQTFIQDPDGYWIEITDAN